MSSAVNGCMPKATFMTCISWAVGHSTSNQNCGRLPYRFGFSGLVVLPCCGALSPELLGERTRLGSLERDLACSDKTELMREGSCDRLLWCELIAVLRRDRWFTLSSV